MKTFLSHKQKHSVKKADYRTNEDILSNKVSSPQSLQKQRQFYTVLTSLCLALIFGGAVQALSSNKSSSDEEAASISSDSSSIDESIKDADNSSVGNADTLPNKDKTESRDSSPATNHSEQTTEITINGEQEYLEQNGKLEKTITSSDGGSTTNVDITVDQNSSGSSSSSSSSINIESNSYSSSSNDTPDDRRDAMRRR